MEREREIHMYTYIYIYIYYPRIAFVEQNGWSLILGPRYHITIISSISAVADISY